MEAGRWHSLYHADHFVPPTANIGLPPNAPRSDEPLTAYEGYTAIAASAAITERLRLGHLVLGNTYRNPALVAKMAANIDQISHGRFTLAIGAGWFRREHEAYGWVFPSMRERSDRLEEAAALIRQLFTRRRPGHLRGPVLPARRGAAVAPELRRADPADDRWHRTEADAAHARHVRRRVQPRRLRASRDVGGVAAGEARDPRAALRARRARSGRDPHHDASAHEADQRPGRGGRVHRADRPEDGRWQR